MVNWIPLIQTLVWPLLILIIGIWLRKPIRIILDAVLTRVQAGGPVKIGPIELQQITAFQEEARLSAESVVAAVRREIAKAVPPGNLGESDHLFSNAVRRATGPLLDIWEGFLQDQTIIAVSVWAMVPGKFERSGVAGFGDALALAKVHALLAALGASGTRTLPASSPEVSLAMSRVPAIAIGGPEGNLAARQILDRCGGRLRFAGLDLVDASTGTRYRAASQYANRLVDYGLVLVSGGDSGEQPPVMVMGGCYGFGTLAAASVVCDLKLAGAIVSQAGSPDFEALVSTKVEAGRIGEPEIVLAYPLESR